MVYNKKKFILVTDDSIEWDGERTRRIICPDMISSGNFYFESGLPTLEIRFLGNSKEESFHGDVAVKVWNLILAKGYEKVNNE